MELARENAGAIVGGGTMLATLTYLILIQEIAEIKDIIKSPKGNNCGLQFANYAG